MIKKAVSILIFLFLIACPQNAFADEHRKEVPANEILKNLSMGEPVNITNAVITGKLDIGEADDIRWKVIRNNISIVNSVFQGDLYLTGLYFEKEVDFHKTKFSGQANFDGSEFNEGAIFSSTNFTEKAIFYNVEFNDIAQFDGTNFLKRASFINATFGGKSWFKAAQFRGEADFNKARFNETHFNGSRFYDKADFRNAQFNGNAYFKDVLFDGEALFITTQFNGGVNFNGTQFEMMKIRWDQIEGKFDYPGHELFYLALIKNFKELGQFEDADDAYYDYRTKRQEQRTWRDFSKYWDIVFQYLCGYGVKPFRALLWGLFIIVFSSYWYSQSGAIEERKTSTSQSTKLGFPVNPGLIFPGVNIQSQPTKPGFLDALYFSVTTFTTVGYGDWYPTSKPLKVPILKKLFLTFRKTTMRILIYLPKHPVLYILQEKILRFSRVFQNLPICLSYRTLAMFEGLFGWFIMALFLITLGKVWIR